MNDTFRKMTRRGTLLTVRRIQAALVLLLVSTLGVGIFVHSLREKDPFVLQARQSSGAKYNFGVILKIAVFVAGMLSFLSIVHSFQRLQAILKRHNRVMSELHGLNRRSDKTEEMFACFIVGYIPLFAVNILQHQGKLHSMDPIVVTKAIFLMTYATNFLVYGRNLRVFFRTFCSVCCPCLRQESHSRGPSRVIDLKNLKRTNCEMVCPCQNQLQVEKKNKQKKNGTAWTQENI